MLIGFIINFSQFHLFSRSEPTKLNLIKAFLGKGDQFNIVEGEVILIDRIFGVLLSIGNILKITCNPTQFMLFFRSKYKELALKT